MIPIAGASGANGIEAARLLEEDYAPYRRGEAAAVSSGVRDATGRAPRSFDSFAHDYAVSFCDNAANEDGRA